MTAVEIRAKTVLARPLRRRSHGVLNLQIYLSYCGTVRTVLKYATVACAGPPALERCPPLWLTVRVGYKCVYALVP